MQSRYSFGKVIKQNLKIKLSFINYSQYYAETVKS